jgi:putative ABC transport system permease protein
MFKSYLTLATRNLVRHRFYALINIIGLSIGIGCFLVAFIYADYEFSFNRQHEKLDRIYNVVSEITGVAGTRSSVYTKALGKQLAAGIPEIESAVQTLNRPMWVSTEERGYTVRTCLASPGILDTFTYPLLRGDPRSLDRPGTAFITQSLASRLFGNEDAIGRTVSVNYKLIDGSFEITGILQDISIQNDPKLRFEFLTSTDPAAGSPTAEWGRWRNWGILSTYLLIRPGADITQVETKIRAIADDTNPQRHERRSYHLQHGPRIHLYTTDDYGPQSDGPVGSISRVTGVVSIGFLILVLACLNYINLVTSQSDTRSREVGLRKVSGATRGALVTQFLGESVVLSAIAFVFALNFTYLILPYGSDILGVQLSLENVDPILFLSGPIALIPIIGILAGIYPALVMSGHQPVESLAGKGAAGHSGRMLRRALVVLQFSASTALIVTTLVVNDQIVYLQNKDLGYETDRIVSLPFFAEDRNLWTQQTAIRASIANIPNVESASVSGTFHSGDFRTVSVEGGPEEEHRFIWSAIDEHTLATFKVDLLHGRNVTVKQKLDPDPYEWGVLINETAAKRIGWKPGTHTVLRHERPGRFHVIGVVKDYHNQNLRNEILPIALGPPYDAVRANYIYARLGSGDLAKTLDAMEVAWKRFLPDRPFRFTFLNERLDSAYRADMTQRKILTFFSALAIVVGCLGTLGLVTYGARRRRKEMGIRKALGAHGQTVIYLLASEFLMLALVAFVVASPIAYTFCADWLNTFTYRIDLPIGAFLVGGLLTLGLVALSISVQTVRASRETPVDALRHE